MKNISETIAANPTLSTLSSALKAADLIETLGGSGPFTVFAPTNDAFAKIPADTLKSVLADKTKLTGILKYHVVAGKVMAKDVGAMKDATTLQGEKIKIDNSKGVMVNDATVTEADIECSNGVIHCIDTVLMP